MAAWLLALLWLLGAPPQEQDKKDQEDAKKEVDPEALWQALDEGNAEKFQAMAADTEKALELIRKGRPLKDAPAGEVKERLKDAFGGETDLWVVVPPRYDKAKPAGVLLVLHGLGGTGAQAKDAWVPFAAANYMIVAAPTALKESDAARGEDAVTKEKEPAQWWTYREGGFPLAALSTLKKRYAIDENRVVLTGYSMGGFATWNVGLRYPDRFAALLPFAGGLSRAEFAGLRVDERLRRLHLNSFDLPVFFAHGELDKNVPVEFDREARNQLKKLGYEYEYKEIPKATHNLNLKDGGEIMTAAEKWLKGRVRKPHPKEVKFFSLGDYCAQAYWVRVAEFKDKTAEVRATIKDQAIEVTATGAKKLTFYLDETMVDLSKPVKVTSGGSKLFDGDVKPEPAVILETWKSREDRDLLYRAKVTVDVK